MWPQIINITIGLWLIISANIFNMSQMTSDNNYIVGPLIITFSVISLWRINRNLIKVNILFGAWLLVALFVLDYTKTVAFFSTGACGAFLITLSAIKTHVTGNFGGGWRSLFQHNPLHLQEAEKMSRQEQ